MLELSDRQKKILWIVVRDYIDSAQPLGSEVILEHYKDLDCSSATIRKELGLLEDQGFLSHPHTSAGRIPTDKGYRFYVDNLMSAYTLTMREKTLVDQLAKSLNNDVNQMMEETVRTLHSISNYATAFRSNNSFLEEMIGQVQKKISAARRESLYLTGLSKLFYEPEFENIENIRRITGLLEEKDKFSKILDEYSDPGKVNITIGHEMKEDELQDYSLVTRDISFKGESLGQIGIIGPTRMQYGRVTKAINTIAELLDDFFESY
jgi:heat-inducible transcriptional repressor